MTDDERNWALILVGELKRSWAELPTVVDGVQHRFPWSTMAEANVDAQTLVALVDDIERRYEAVRRAYAIEAQERGRLERIVEAQRDLLDRRTQRESLSESAGRTIEAMGDLIDRQREALEALVAWDKRWPHDVIHSAGSFKQCHDELAACVGFARDALVGRTSS